MMSKLFKNDADKVKAFQNYVAQIETVLLRYGISGDGELMSKELMEQMNQGGLTGTDQLDFLHQVADNAFVVEKMRQFEAEGRGN
jgi:hypothetical protein